jgi:hypothetical protein
MDFLRLSATKIFIFLRAYSEINFDRCLHRKNSSYEIGTSAFDSICLLNIYSRAISILQTNQCPISGSYTCMARFQTGPNALAK